MKWCKKSRFLFCDNIHKLTTVIEYNNYMHPIYFYRPVN